MQKEHFDMEFEKIVGQHIAEIETVFNNFWQNPENLEQLKSAANTLVECLKNGNKVLSCGNGGSMSDAIHFAEELVGRFRDPRKPLPAIAMSDVGNITCIANDFGYEYIFSRVVEALGNEGDVLLAISTSGNSKNVLEAVKTAKEKKLKTIALTGKSGGKLKDLADISIIVPHNGYADRIQEIHIQIIHFFIQYIEQQIIG